MVYTDKSCVQIIFLSFVLALAIGCVGPTQLSTATPVPFLARQLDVKIDPKEAATYLLNPNPLGKDGYPQGMVVTIDILPKRGWWVDKWVGPVYNIDGTTAQIQMDSSKAVAVRLKATTLLTVTPTPGPTVTPTPGPTVTPTPGPTVTPTPGPTVTPRPTATPQPTVKTSADSYFDNGMEYFDDENWSMAVEEFTLAIQIKFRLEDAYFNRGYAYNNLGQYQNAITDFTKAILIAPDYALYYSWRGYVYSENGQYQNAITDYTEAIELAPNDAMNYNNRGYVYWRITQKGKWREDQRKACSLETQYC